MCGKQTLELFSRFKGGETSVEQLKTVSFHVVPSQAADMKT